MKNLFLLFFLLLAAGCSKKDWMAKLYAMKADSAISEASMLKEKKVPYEGRVKFYASACDYFLKAYESDSRVFTLSRIEEAADVCWRAGNKETEEVFKVFEESYIKEHPKEYEYGDSGVAMMEMG